MMGLGMLLNSPTSVFNSKIFPQVILPDSLKKGKGRGAERAGERRGRGCVMAVGGMDAPGTETASTCDVVAQPMTIRVHDMSLYLQERGIRPGKLGMYLLPIKILSSRIEQGDVRSEKSEKLPLLTDFSVPSRLLETSLPD